MKDNMMIPLQLRRAVYFIGSVTGMASILRRIYRRMYKSHARVLYLHRVIDTGDPLYPFLKRLRFLTVEDFHKRLKYILKHYTFVSIDEYSQYLQNAKRWPSDIIAMTFDDGYGCFYTNVFPLLKKYNVPAMVFLSTGCLNNNGILLHDRLTYIIGATSIARFRLPELGPESFSLATESERVQVYHEISQRLKRIPNAERAMIVEKLSRVLLVSENEVRRNIRMLSWAEIREMADSGLVTFGAHTVSHPILSRVSIEEAKKEILYSKLVIEKELGVPVRFLAYPNGREADFNESIKEVARQIGYEFAFTTIEKIQNKHDPYELPRYGVIKEDFYRFTLRMAGLFDIYNGLRKDFNM